MADTLLVIEDDINLGNVLRLILSANKFQVHVADNGLTGLQKAYTYKPDAVLLDIMLPDMDGWQVCSRLKEMSDVPIIMVSALSSEENIIKGLELGADDFIVKPVSTEELVARIRAVLRRSPCLSQSHDNGQENTFSYNNLMVDFNRSQVMVNGQRIWLSPTEFRLLAVLIRYKGRLLSYDFLLREVWGPEYTHELNYLRTYMSYLRQKLEKDATKPDIIYNERGLGYQFG
jgi:two-component system KDP operon response regulator KdpE